MLGSYKTNVPEVILTFEQKLVLAGFIPGA